MAIDYVIDYDCIPKQQFTSDSILERLKGEERARTIIALFREHGDPRPPSEMGFEFTRSTPTGEEEYRVIVVQELLDAVEDLRPVEHHCQGCPANLTGKPFGCMGFVHYPVSEHAERWLMNRLPMPEEALVWLLLRQGIDEFKYDGATVKPLRASGDTYFKDPYGGVRRLGEFEVNANQVFEMVFAVGNVSPNHAALLLLFFGAINRSLEADQIMNITPAGADVDQKHPFAIRPESGDDTTTVEIKEFLRALYLAWTLNVRLLVDA